MRRISALLAVAAVIALAVFAGSASATPPPTPPNGWSGACNMLQDPTMLPGSGGPMDKNNPNGNDGMFRAVSVSGGNCV